MNIIELKNINKCFKLPKKKGKTNIIEEILYLFNNKNYIEELWALKNINLNIKKGEVIAIIGENGAGKSTLLKIISKIIHPTSGKVNVYGKTTPIIELGLGFQDNLTGRENVYIYGSILGIKRKILKKKLKEIVKFAELEKFIDVTLKNYSDGMRMRLAFATTIFSDLDILLIDDGLGIVGDLRFQKKCAQKLIEYKKLGKTIIIVSHVLKQMEICDRCVYLEKGRVKNIGKTKKILKEYYKDMIKK